MSEPQRSLLAVYVIYKKRVKMLVLFYLFLGVGREGKNWFLLQGAFLKSSNSFVTHYHGQTLLFWLSWLFQFKVMCITRIFLKSSVFIWTYMGWPLYSHRKGTGTLASRTNKKYHNYNLRLGSGLITKERFGNNGLRCFNALWTYN